MIKSRKIKGTYGIGVRKRWLASVLMFIILMSIVTYYGGIEAQASGSRQRAADIAYGELGNTNGSKYGSGQWCVHFARWCALQAGLSSSEWPSAGGSTVLTVRAFQQLGRWHNKVSYSWSFNKSGTVVSSGGIIDNYTPQPGDFVAIENDGSDGNGPDHTGLVYSVNGNTLTTIEGNYSSKVSMVTYNLSTRKSNYGSAKFVGFGEPAYSTSGVTTPNSISFGQNEVTVKKGSTVQIPFTFKGDGIIYLDPRSDNTGIASAYCQNVNWTTGNATLCVTGNAGGSTKITLHFLDANKNSFFTKSINVKVTEDLKITFDKASSSFKVGEDYQVNFAVNGSGFKHIDYSISDTSIADAVKWGDGGFNNSTGRAGLVIRGKKRGSTRLTIKLLDENMSTMYSQSCTLVVEEGYGITFDYVLSNYFRVGEDYQVNFAVSGSGFAQIDYSIYDTSIADAVKWADGGYNSNTGRAGLVVRGKKSGTTFLTIKLLDANKKVLYSEDCTLVVRDALSLEGLNTSIGLSEGTTYTEKFTFDGWGVSSIVASSSDTSVATADVTVNKLADRKGELNITTKKSGQTRVEVKLLDSTGKTLLSKNITVTVSSSEHTIRVGGVSNGIVRLDKITAKRGDIVNVKVTPAAGYELDTLTATPVGGSAQSIKNTLRFTMPNADVNVNATFKKKAYTISTGYPANGFIRVSSASAIAGELVTVSVTPNSGYELDKITVNAGSGDVALAGNSFIMPYGNVRVNASFKLLSSSNTYSISSDTTEGGSIYLSKWSASEGTPIDVHYTAKSGYTLDSITYKTTSNGNVVDITTTRTFLMPASPVELYVRFRPLIAGDNEAGGESTSTDSNPTLINDITAEDEEEIVSDDSNVPTVLDDVIVVPNVEPGTKTFYDVPMNVYYYDSVYWALNRGITQGTSETTFGPEDTCTRAQIVTFLWKAMGSNEPYGNTGGFSDAADSSAWYYRSVLWAVENGITSGVGNGLFGTNTACTRAQVMTFLWRASGSPEPVGNTSTFNDTSNTSAYYYKAVLWAIENNITSGVGNGLFGVDQPCTRAQVVTFLYRAYH